MDLIIRIPLAKKPEEGGLADERQILAAATEWLNQPVSGHWRNPALASVGEAIAESLGADANIWADEWTDPIIDIEGD